MPKLLKIVLTLIFWIAFGYVILEVDYPENITSATFFQLSSFFISLLLALTFTINILFNFFFSFFVALGLIILLALKSLDSLNPASFSLTTAATLLLVSYFKKIKKHQSLTSRLKIPKLRTLQRKK